MEPNPTQRQIAQEWAKITIIRWKRNLFAMKVGKSGDLARSFAFQLTGSANSVSIIRLAYSLSGQFVDMGVGKGQKIGSIKGNKEELRAAGIRGRKEGRHAKKWYSKTMYAETATLGDLFAKHYGIESQTVILENLPEKI